MDKTFESQARKIKKYGWLRSLPDQNATMLPLKMTLTLPQMVDLRPQCPKVYDQGDLGSCTANAIGGLVQFLAIKQGQPSWVPSRLFIYYNERVLEGTVDYDAGAYISDGMKVVNKLGAPHEALWWYNTKKFAVKPNLRVYVDAEKHQLRSFGRIDNTNLNSIKTCLASGFPIVAGFTVYESFESQQVATTGVVPMPQQFEQVLGGHAVLIVGYNDTTNRFMVRNSWGTRWGMQGYFTMPYLYLSNSNYADDFWSGYLME